MRPVRYNVAASLDGYIADAQHGFDWIPMDPAVDFAALFARVDTVLVGRRTYEVVRGMAEDPFPAGARLYVVSRTMRPEAHPEVTVVSEDLGGVVAGLRAEPGDGEIWLFGGGELFRDLLAAGQVDTVEVTVAPILLGGGVPLLAPGGPRAPLVLRGTHTYPSGLVTLRYGVPRAAP